MNISYADFSVLLIYFTIVLYVGFRHRKGDTTAEQYMLLGRQMTLPAFVLTLVSTWYGGILGVAEWSYRYGISCWFVFGIPYYFFATVFALFFASKARDLEVDSIPDLLTKHYGKGAGMLSALWVVLQSSPAPYLFTVAFLLNYFFGLPLWVGLVLSGIYSFVFIHKTGLKAVVSAHVIQCVLMYGGFILLLGSCIYRFGSPVALFKQLEGMDPLKLTATGGLGWQTMVVWFFIASTTLTAPSFHQRIYAVNKGASARKGILISVAMWIWFDAMTTFCGMYAFANLSGLSDPQQAYLVLGENLLPTGVYGLFIVALFAIVMSTLDGFAFVTATTISNDLMRKSKYFDKFSLPRLTQIGLALTLLISIAISLWLPSVVEQFFTIGTIVIPGMLLPVVFAMRNWTDFPKRAVQMNLILAPAVAFFCYMNPGWYEWTGVSEVQPFFPGIITSVVIFTVAWVLGMWRESTDSLHKDRVEDEIVH